MKIFLWLLRIASAVILFQTLFFKFSGAAESVYIFSSIHAEPWGRWGSGVAELIAGVLLLIPGTQAVGGLLAAGVMAGAILTHLFVIGIAVQGDGGLLFGLACAVFIASGVVVVANHGQLFQLAARLRGKNAESQNS